MILGHIMWKEISNKIYTIYFFKYFMLHIKKLIEILN